MQKSSAILPRVAFIALIGCVVVVTAGAGIYHLTHGGLGSGPTELIMSILIALSAYFIIQESGGNGSGSHRRSLRNLGTSVIFLAALILIAFSIYHLLTSGLPSAITETCLAVLLLLADYIALTRL